MSETYYTFVTVDYASGGLETLFDLSKEHGRLPEAPSERIGEHAFRFLYRTPEPVFLERGDDWYIGYDVDLGPGVSMEYGPEPDPELSCATPTIPAFTQVNVYRFPKAGGHC